MTSTIAGIAFGLSGLGLVHSCSHPLSAIYNIPHGVANAILLPNVIEYNLIANRKKYADIARIFESKLFMEDHVTASNALVEQLDAFLKSVDIPKDFSYLELNLTNESIDLLARDAMNDIGTVSVNARKVHKEDVIKIYKKVFIFE